MKTKKWPAIFLCFAFLAGILLMTYPVYSSYWNVRHETKAIASYTKSVAISSTKQEEELLAAADAYNAALRNKKNRWQLSKTEEKEYENLLVLDKNSVQKVMGYLEIPKIQSHLPIYHGTDEEVLQVGVGHLKGSSLPVGGKGTHAVLSGHRGLPSASLFTNLDELSEGDIFIVQVLNRTLTYEVDQIRIVQPEDTKNLEIEDDQDYCTLLTCTPYGINSHRLLVRGHRIANLENGKYLLPADGVRLNRKKTAVYAALPIWTVSSLWKYEAAKIVEKKRRKKFPKSNVLKKG